MPASLFPSYRQIQTGQVTSADSMQRSPFHFQICFPAFLPTSGMPSVHRCKGFLRGTFNYTHLCFLSLSPKQCALIMLTYLWGYTLQVCCRNLYKACRAFLVSPSSSASLISPTAKTPTEKGIEEEIQDPILIQSFTIITKLCFGRKVLLVLNQIPAENSNILIAIIFY